MKIDKEAFANHLIEQFLMFYASDVKAEDLEKLTAEEATALAETIDDCEPILDGQDGDGRITDDAFQVAVGIGGALKTAFAYAFQYAADCAHEEDAKAEDAGYNRDADAA